MRIERRRRHILGQIAVFGLLFFTGLWLHDEISLPFSNPWDIKGPLAVFFYNPSNNIVRFLFLVTMPSVVVGLLYFVGTIKRFFTYDSRVFHFELPSERNGFVCKVVWVCVLAALLIGSGSTYRSGTMDTFHEGETLGPAVDYLHGKTPYKETIFIHGPFRDPLRSVIAFSMFGKSIGAVRTLGSILAIITTFFFLIGFYFLYKRNISYAALSVFTLLIIRQIRPFGVLFHLGLADIGYVLLMISVALLEERIRDDKGRSSDNVTYIALLLLAFVPTVSFANSVDRGFYQIAASVVFLLAVYVLFMAGRRWRALFAIGSGYGLGILILGFSIKWAYGEFFNYVFLVLPKLDPILNGFVYPFKDIRFLIPVLCVSGIVFWLTSRVISLQNSFQGTFLKKAKRFYADYFLEIFLLLLSLTCYRRALGRSELGHLGDAIGPISILFIYVVMRHWVAPFVAGMRRKDMVLPAAAIAVTVLFTGIAIKGTNWATWYKFPLDIEDRELIPGNYLATISFLKEQLGPEEDFLTMTSEASWYYFVDRPCPIRFQVIYQAMPPFYQKEIVDDLRKKNVKYVLYRNGHWANAIDGFDNQARLPVVMKYLDDEYTFFKKIDDNEIWVRKTD